jgi:hypothetical protein
MNAIVSVEEAVVSNRYGHPITMYRPVPLKGAAEQSPEAIAKAALIAPFSFYTSYDNTTKAVNDLIGPSVIVPVHLRMENPLRLPNGYAKWDDGAFWDDRLQDGSLSAEDIAAIQARVNSITDHVGQIFPEQTIPIVAEYLQKNGYDGLVYRTESTADCYITFRADQAVLAGEPKLVQPEAPKPAFDNSLEGIQKAWKLLQKFVGRSQLATMKSLSKGEEEGQFFIDKALEMANRIAAMPGVGDTDGEEPLRDKIAYLHYFRGSMDAYIYEKDIVDGEGQWQAKGYSDLYGDGLFGEYGYCCIQEYIDHGVELDLYFTPRPIGDILREKHKRNDDDTSDNTPAPGA